MEKHHLMKPLLEVLTTLIHNSLSPGMSKGHLVHHFLECHGIPESSGSGGSGSASIFSAGFGNLIHNVPCFPFKELGVGRLNYLSFEKCSSRVTLS